jgi:hypothetical protein
VEGLPVPRVLDHHALSLYTPPDGHKSTRYAFTTLPFPGQADIVRRVGVRTSVNFVGVARPHVDASLLELDLAACALVL